MIKPILKLLLEPYPIRSITISLIRRFALRSYPWRVGIGAVERPHYGYCVYNAAVLASKLGYRRISVLELGVAGGRGLLNLEYHAQQVSRVTGIAIDVYGFDTGAGLPKPTDYRDLPYHWKAGFYRMDVENLKSRLSSAKLVLGDIQDTSTTFFRDYDPAPIGAVMCDLDFYSSTAAAFGMFDVDEKYRLPRVYCYLDDIVGTEVELYNDYTGVRLAVKEFNDNHKERKISAAYHLLCQKVVQPWYHHISVLHDFGHSRYNEFVSEENQERPLSQTLSIAF